MKPSQALTPIGPRLALLAMLLAVVLSVRAGVENLFCVIRGIVAFAATLWVFRTGAGMLDAIAAPPPPAQAPPVESNEGGTIPQAR
jgi:hypothetical protein